MVATLLELIDRLDELDDSDAFSPLILYADDGPDSVPTSRAMICADDDEENSSICSRDTTLSYVLSVQQARECIEVFSEWRDGRRPTDMEKFAAVMYYSRNDAWLPLESP